MSDVVDTVTGADAKKEAKRAAERQQRALNEQKLRDKKKTLSAEDEVARRRALAQGQGGFRKSLLRSSETGSFGMSGGGAQPRATALGG